MINSEAKKLNSADRPEKRTRLSRHAKHLVMLALILGIKGDSLEIPLNAAHPRIKTGSSAEPNPVPGDSLLEHLDLLPEENNFLSEDEMLKRLDLIEPEDAAPDINSLLEGGIRISEYASKDEVTTLDSLFNDIHRLEEELKSTKVDINETRKLLELNIKRKKIESMRQFYIREYIGANVVSRVINYVDQKLNECDYVNNLPGDAESKLEEQQQIINDLYDWFIEVIIKTEKRAIQPRPDDTNKVKDKKPV